MSINTSRAVAQHRKLAQQLIHSSDQVIFIRLPVDVVSSGVNPLFGDPTREVDDTGITYGPFKCLWLDALSIGSTSRGIENVVERLSGQYREATAFAELWLDDILIDPSNAVGKTWLDRSQEVLYLNQRFKYIGDARIGFATVTPYTLIAALKGGVGNVT